MNRDMAKRILANIALVQALAAGKTIQHDGNVGGSSPEWEDLPSPSFTSDPAAYRIKPEKVKVEGWVCVEAGGGWSVGAVNPPLYTPAQSKAKWQKFSTTVEVE